MKIIEFEKLKKSDRKYIGWYGFYCWGNDDNFLEEKNNERDISFLGKLCDIGEDGFIIDKHIQGSDEVVGDAKYFLPVSSDEKIMEKYLEQKPEEEPEFNIWKATDFPIGYEFNDNRNFYYSNNIDSLKGYIVNHYQSMKGKLERVSGGHQFIVDGGSWKYVSPIGSESSTQPAQMVNAMDIANTIRSEVQQFNDTEVGTELYVQRLWRLNGIGAGFRMFNFELKTNVNEETGLIESVVVSDNKGNERFTIDI